MGRQGTGVSAGGPLKSLKPTTHQHQNKYEKKLRGMPLDASVRWMVMVGAGLVRGRSNGNLYIRSSRQPHDGERRYFDEPVHHRFAASGSDPVEFPGHLLGERYRCGAFVSMAFQWDP